MVVALGPGKFYGSNLPRPRIYKDVKLNKERVDPPAPVMDPFLSWAEEAHWSMGGLSFTRHQLQGRIEGNVKKLRAEREKLFKKAQKQNSSEGSVSAMIGSGKGKSRSRSKSPSPPPAPVAVKRRYVGLVDEEDSASSEEEEREVKRTARKLGDDFDRVANENKGNPVKAVGGAVAARTRSRRNEEEGSTSENEKRIKSKGKINGETKGAVQAKGIRSSPRLANRGSA